MNDFQRAIVLTVISLLFMETAWPQGRRFDERRTGPLISQGPLPKVTVDNDGNAVFGGDSELQVRGALLVVRSNSVRGKPTQRFLAFPLDDRHPKGVRVVNQAGPDCHWTSAKTLLAGVSETKGNLALYVEEQFSVSAGPFKGQDPLQRSPKLPRSPRPARITGSSREYL